MRLQGKTKFRTRLLALLLCFAWVLSVMPAQAVYWDPTRSAAPPGFVPTQNSGKGLVTYDRFNSTLSSNLQRLQTDLATGVDDSFGRHFNGFNNKPPSAQLIAEYLGYYLINCWWADYTMLFNENNLTYYNAFYSNNSEITELDTYYQVCEDLKTFYNNIRDDFGDTPSDWTKENNDAIWAAVNYNGVATSVYNVTDPTKGLLPGTGSYGVAVQGIVQSYLQENITNVLAAKYLSAEEISSITSSSGSGVAAGSAILSYIGERLKDGTLREGGSAEPAASAPEEEAPPVVDVVPIDDFKWDSISLSNSLFVGDSQLMLMAYYAGWLGDDVPDINSLPNTMYANSDGNHPAIACQIISPNSIKTYSTALKSLVLDQSTETVFSGVEHVYVLYGVDKAVGDDTLLTAEEYTAAMRDEISVFTRAITSSQATVTVLTPAAVSDAADNSAGIKINSWNSFLNSATDMNSLIADIGYDGHVRSLNVNCTASAMDKYYNAVQEACEAAAKPSSNQVQTPTGTTDKGYEASDLYNLYMKNEDALRPYFQIYNNLRKYISGLWTTAYSDAGEYKGYQLTPSIESYIVMNEFARQLDEWGFQQSDFYNNTATPGFQPGDQPVDNSYIESVNQPLPLLSNAMIQNNEVIVPNGELDDAELNIIGYTALAAGVIYDPFVSKAGNSAYFEVARYMLSGAEEENIQKIERLLHEAYTRKKPVYVLDGTTSSWSNASDLETAPSGDYRYAKLSDLLQSEEAITRVYTVVKGGMEPSTVDGNTWEYSQGYTTTAASSDQSSGGDSVAGIETTDDNAHIQSEGKTATVAGMSIVATSQEMAAPIMFSSGAKTAVVSGNMASSAGGYASCLGGLTTIIVHNAAQDAKDNDAVQHPDNYLLFMNGLGDIVLEDGTIVLPAIANPAIYNYDEIAYSVDQAYNWVDIGVTLLAGIGSAAAVAGAIVLAPESAGLSLGSIPVILGVGGATGAAANASVKLIGNAMDFYGEGDAPEVVLDVYDNTSAFYPYSAAFMNHYPSTIINSEGNLAVTNTNDTGKYVIGIDSSGNILARAIAGLNNRTQANLQYSGGGVTIAPVQGLSFDVTSNSRDVGTAVPYVGGNDGTFLSKFNTAHKFEYYMVKDTIFSGDDQAFFPLNDDIADLKDSYLGLAGPLVTSARRFLMVREPGGAATEHHDTFNVRRYVVDMCGQGLMGTQYSETLQKNYQISYDEMVADTGNRLLVFFTQLVESAVDTLGSIDGVLAIKNGYENKFFNTIVQFIQQFYFLIIVVLMVIVAIKFMRGHYNMLFVMFIGALCFCGFEVYANWMPTVVPAMYNFAVNDAVEQIAWNTVTVSAESYSETYKDSNRKDTTTGALKPYTATLTLYKMTQTDMETVADRLGTTPLAIKSGEIHYLDEAAGIFIQGDAIKMSVDRLLVNNTMRGLYYSQWLELSSEMTESDGFITPITDDLDKVSNPYSIQLTQPYVSLEAYYMPFNEIERAFMINLNAFASVFRFERNQFSYGRNLYKDAFLFNCYTNSGIFTAPGVKEVLRENIRVGSVLGGYDYGTDDDNVAALLNRVYGGNGVKAVFQYPDDWLNVAAVFRSPSTNMKESLWGQMLQKRGWYNEDWEITDPDALGDLVYYINTHTKQFVIDNSDQLNYCSDENAIKLVSLYATTCFTHYVSQFGNWLYPNYLNAADVELKDVLYGSMTTLRDRNVSNDGTVVNTVASKLGIFGVLFILFITVFATVFVFVVTYLVPVLYALFGVVIIYKLINDQNGVGLVSGYLKVTLTTCILYFIFSLSLRLVEVGGYAWYGYLGCALLMFLCCYFLFWVCLSVVQNIGEMGNDVLGQNLLRGLDHITRGAVRKLTTNTLNARRGIHGYGGRRYGYPGYGSPYQYGRGYGIDDRNPLFGSRSAFGMGRGRRGYNDYDYGGYGRGASYDYGMYERENRRGLTGLIGGMTDRFSRGSRDRQQTSSESSTRTGRDSGMSRYAANRSNDRRQ